MTPTCRKLALPAAVILAAIGGITTLDAQTPPAAEALGQTDRAALRKELFQALKQARNEAEARAAESRIWAFWMQGPDKQATEQIQAILAARRADDNDKALQIAEALVARRPDYAEGWNQKATLLFLKGDFDGSLKAIARVLALEPKHFGALAGKAVILMQQGHMQLAQSTLREAVAIDPFLNERGLLIEPKGLPI